METNGEGGGGGEAERRGRSELGRLLEAIGSSEVLEKRTYLIKQLEEFSADDLGLILQGLLASWIDSTCSGVSHCTLHRSILQVALKCSDLDITHYLGQFLTLGAKVTSLSFSISTKLFDAAAKCITVLGLEMAEENKADDMEVALGMRQGPHQEVEMPSEKGEDMEVAPWSVAPLPQKASRRCTHCASKKTRRWRRGPSGPRTLCNAWGQWFWNGQLPYSNSKKRPLSSKDNSAAGNDVVALVDVLPCGVGASLDAFFDHTVPSASWEEAGPARAEEEEEEELEWLLNKDAFPSVETMAVEVEVEEAPALDAPPARTKGRQHVTANAVQTRRRCTHCETEETPQWRKGPEGARTLCNACGVVFKKKGRLLPEYRPVKSPAFLPQLHSNRHLRALDMHRQNGPTSSSSPQRYSPLSRVTSAAGRATVEACSGEARHGSMEVQLLSVPERPPVDSPGFSLLLRSRPINRHGEEIFAAIRATAKARRAERSAARLAVMDN